MPDRRSPPGWHRQSGALPSHWSCGCLASLLDDHGGSGETGRSLWPDSERRGVQGSECAG